MPVFVQAAGRVVFNVLLRFVFSGIEPVSWKQNVGIWHLHVLHWRQRWISVSIWGKEKVHYLMVSMRFYAYASAADEDVVDDDDVELIYMGWIDSKESVWWCP